MGTRASQFVQAWLPVTTFAAFVGLSISRTVEIPATASSDKQFVTGRINSRDKRGENNLFVNGSSTTSSAENVFV